MTDLIKKFVSNVAVNTRKTAEEKPAPATRVGRVGLTTYHEPLVVQQLKVLAAEKGTTQQKLVAEALNLLFAREGKDEIA